MRVLAVVNPKGGTGKTTTAVNVAAALQARRRAVTLVDLDPQGHSTAWCGLTPRVTGSWGWFGGGAVEPEEAAWGDMQCIPAHPQLVGVEAKLTQTVGRELTLRRAWAGVGGRQAVWVVDTPGDLGVLTINALCAATAVLVPVQPSTVDLSGLQGVFSVIQQVREVFNPDLKTVKVVLTRVRGGTRMARDAQGWIGGRWPGALCKTAVRETVRHTEALAHTLPITHYDAGGVGAADYRALSKEVF